MCSLLVPSWPLRVIVLWSRPSLSFRHRRPKEHIETTQRFWPKLKIIQHYANLCYYNSGCVGTVSMGRMATFCPFVFHLFNQLSRLALPIAQTPNPLSPIACRIPPRKPQELRTFFIGKNQLVSTIATVDTRMRSIFYCGVKPSDYCLRYSRNLLMREYSHDIRHNHPPQIPRI